VLRGVLARAEAEGRPVALRVLRNNVRARALYERLGFRAVGETPTKVELRYEPGARPARDRAV
jgi:ribosomal protein S18 acetylase RimI-like enzyme